MTVRCKFYVDTITETMHGKVIKLLPVVSGSPENESFFKWTPSGHIEFGTVNKEASEQFRPGKTFYVDFVEAEEVKK